MAINAKSINDAASLAVDSAKIAQGLTKLGKRNSIMKMAEPGMYQYPLMISNAVEMEAAIATAKALQMTFASAVVTAYSLNPVMYLKDYNEPSQFVRRFHSNNSVPVNFNTASNALGIESATTNDIEDAEITEATLSTSFSEKALESLAIQSWEDVTEQLDTSSLNDMYRPYDRTQRIMNEKISTMKTANEAGLAGAFNGIRNTADDINNVINSRNDQSNVGLNPATNTQYYQDKEKIDPKTGRVSEIQYSGTKSTSVGAVSERKFSNSIVRNEKLEALQPTMVNVQIVCHGNAGNGAGANQFTQNLTLGVKVMPRVVQSSVMIASMVEASKNSHGIFKFLKWTKGEQKTLDFVLGITAAKKKAIQQNAKIEVKTLQQAKKRKKQSNLFARAMKNDTFPTLSIVITSFEASKIKEVTGVDLNELKNAIKLMNEYFLLSFGIYDTEQNTLKILFDSDDDWGYTSIGAMTSMMNKTNDLLNQAKIMNILGRR